MSDKKTDLYVQCCDKLDNIQGAIYELLSLGLGLDSSPMELITEATKLVGYYDGLSDEERLKVIEISDQILAGTITPEDVSKAVPELTKELFISEEKTVSKSKKPLLN